MLFEHFNPSNVKELRGVVKGRNLGEEFPILFFAVQRNSSEIVRILCDAGADPRIRTQPLNLPILPYTVISSEYDLSDKTDVLLSLLAKGADPHDIPSDMWEEPLKTPKGDLFRKPRWGVFGDDRWHLPGALKALARNLTLAHRYLLWRTGHFEFREERLLQVAEAFSLLPLLELPFHVVGQTYAINQVIGEVVSHFLFKSECPLILLFTGPSGHGKTEIAKQMGRLLSLDIHNVDCTEMKYETDIFGPKFPYRGHEQGSRLNNFLANHAGERAVVFLDEFDKTTEEVRKALLLPFDNGAYVDRRDQKKLDMSKIIWILAANFGENEVQEYWSSHIEGRSEVSQKSEEFEKVSHILDGLIIGKIGAPLFGRISRTIPFLPFSELEKPVATYKFMREFRNEVRGPIDVSNKSFPRHIALDYHDDGQLAQHLAKRGYVTELGARSLKNIVARQIKQKLARSFLLEKGTIHDEMNEKPLDAYEARLVSTGKEEHEVVLKRAGFKSISKLEKGLIESPEL